MVKDDHVVKDDHGILRIPENVSKFEYTLMEVSVNSMWLQGRKFRTLSEKPKNAIKIKIGCVVIKLRVLKLNPDHL